MDSRFLLAVVFAGLTVGLQAQPLVGHEWGTFTSLQDEEGRTLDGINTDDEPVPSFCHDMAPRLVLNRGGGAWGLLEGARREDTAMLRCGSKRRWCIFIHPKARPIR